MPTALETGPGDAHTLIKDFLNQLEPSLNTVLVFALSLQIAGTPLEAGPVEAFYAAREGALVWTGEANAAHFDALIEALASASDHGLDPSDYGYADLRAADAAIADPALDRLATEGWMTLAQDLATGRLDPREYGAAFDAPEPLANPADSLALMIASGEVVTRLEVLAPHRPEYRALQAALVRYREIAKQGGWHPIEPGPALHPGDRDVRVLFLRDRLQTEGLMPVLAWPGPGQFAEFIDSVMIYDDAVAAAVAEVQRSAHLEPDGIAGADTIDWLNIPVEHRIAQIEAGLERWRWLPRDPAPLRVEVNLPDYRLAVYGAEGFVRTHDVIVGRPSRPSPMLQAQMRYMILNPWWETPHRLAVLDELPLFRRDPGAVDRLGFVVLDRETGEAVDATEIDWTTVSARDFPYRLRQRPGPHNALGVVKFIFPNPFSTFLHDTSARELFDRPARAFSSGCVRVRDAVELAEWVAGRASETDNERLHDALDSGRETRIDLLRPIDVRFLYFTAVANGEGGVRFVPDVYGLDARLIAALGGAPETGNPDDEDDPDEFVLADGGGECGVGF
ncbi:MULTISPECIES: L,D-transpeptidase family protein [Hyphobacterium]|uniref:Murein L,D-transpeptidase n=1 Tax=Hyphobacterium vulgare TaxID=1736751 RepID=A0ABV6ZV41_9PROT